MYLLKKVFQLREQVHEDHEKPFLEHLEDLRVMVTRIVVTLAIAVSACFVFHKPLMAVLLRPVDQIWAQKMKAAMPQHGPRQVSFEKWQRALALAAEVERLDEPTRRALFEALGEPEIEFHTRAIIWRRAAELLPEAKRRAFIDAAIAETELKEQVGALLEQPDPKAALTRSNPRMMSALRPTESFVLSMKLAFFAGLIVSFPLLLWYVLQFVLPGLHSHERKVLWPAMAIGFGLFLLGVCFAYFIVLPRALGFFYDWSSNMGVSNDWRIGEYMSFATQFTLLFGLSFELPVVVMVLVKLGLLEYPTMQSTRSYAVVAIFVLAAIITPTPDLMTMTLMAAPMIVLYEVCIWLAYFDWKKNRTDEAQADRERMAWLLSSNEPGNSSQAGYEPGDGDDGWRVEDTLPHQPGLPEDEPWVEPDDDAQPDLPHDNPRP